MLIYKFISVSKTAKTKVSATKENRDWIESPKVCRRGFNLAKHYFNILIYKFTVVSKTAKTEVSATKENRGWIESPKVCRRGFNLAKCHFNILVILTQY